MILLKNSFEIEYIRKSNRIIAELFELLKKSVRPGVSTGEIDKISEDFIFTKGATASFKGYRLSSSYPAYPAATCISVNEQVIHGIPGDYVLKDGDIVSIDVGTILSGFYGDATHTYMVGNVKPEYKKLVEDTKQALMLGIDAAREGNYLNEIGKAISFYLNPKGYGIIRDYCGHGVGKALHEDPPVLNYYDPKRKGPRLKKGMVLAIEPMITLGGYEVNVLRNGWTVVTADKSYAVHWEHSIAVTDGEPIILSSL
ncbi:MAG: type I methionyl aminopeptidase [Brevinematales bacterium]|jgi:methionyl aminopeptidase